jgi:hypothetical protein
MTMIVATVLAGAAVAQTSHQSHGAGPQGTMPMPQMDMSSMQQMIESLMPAPCDPQFTKDFKAAAIAMTKDMYAPYSGNLDVDFGRK